jgi:hypothetical protein
MSDMLARLAARAQGSPLVLGRRVGYRFEPAAERHEAWPGEEVATRLGDAFAAEGRAESSGGDAVATTPPSADAHVAVPRTNANGFDAAMRAAAASPMRAAAPAARHAAGQDAAQVHAAGTQVE